MLTDILLLFWIVLSTVGTTLSAYGLWDGLQDLSATRGLTNGRRLLAKTYAQTEALRFSVQVIWLLVGCLSWLGIHMNGGPAQRPPTMITPGLIAIYWGNLALILKSLLQLRARNIVRH